MYKNVNVLKNWMPIFFFYQLFIVIVLNPLEKAVRFSIIETRILETIFKTMGVQFISSFLPELPYFMNQVEKL